MPLGEGDGPGVARPAHQTDATDGPEENAELWRKPPPLSGDDVRHIKIIDFEKDEQKEDPERKGIKISYFN